MRHLSVWNLRRGNLQRLVPKSFEENTTQISFSERRQNHNDQFPGIFRTTRHLQSRNHSCSRRNANQQTLFEWKPSRHIDCVIIAYRDDFINIFATQNARNKTGTNSLNFVRRWLSAGKHRAIHWFYGNSLERRFPGLDVFRNAGDRSTSANPRDQKVNASVRVLPNFGSGSFEVNLRIRRVVKLLQHVSVWSRSQQLLSLQNRALHSPRAWRKNDLSAQSQ